MKFYHKNPRQISERRFSDLRRWLRELGDLSGIVHDLNSDEVVGGNQRVRVFNVNACEVTLVEGPHEPDEQGTVALGYVTWEGKRYGYRQVRWTPRQCEQANVVANKAGGGWDWDVLANEFEVGDLLEWGFDEAELGMAGFGFDEEEPPAPEPQIDRATELQEKWRVERGQVWEVPSRTVAGRCHRVMCGDSTDEGAVERLSNGAKVALIVTDPPFAITGSATGSDDMSGLDIIAPFFRLWMKNWFRLLPMLAHVYVCCDWRTYAMVDGEAKRQKAVPKNCIVWRKTTGGGLGSFYQNCHEFIWFGVVQPPRRIKKNLTGHHTITGVPNIWEIAPVTYGSGKHKANHTANKPAELFVRAIENSSGVGDVIGDPFVGAGTCLVACEKTGRVGYGMEIEPKYIAVTLERLEGMGLEPRLA